MGAIAIAWEVLTIMANSCSCSFILCKLKVLQLNIGWGLDVTGDKSSSISCCCDSAVRIL